MRCGTSELGDYRTCMVNILIESFRMTQQFLSEADFDEAFPNVFGRPTKDHPEVSIRNECGLLIRKAQMHMNAVLRANKGNNLHSLAVHMRVVLECAAQVVSRANAIADGSPKELRRVLNASDYEFKDAMARFSRGSTSKDEAQNMIIAARRSAGDYETKPPKRVTITDRINQLSGGEGWYDHLSKYFCHSQASALAGISFCGGVTSIDTEEDGLAFAMLLDYLTEQVILMLSGYGFLLIAVNGDSQPHDKGLRLLNKKRSAARMFRRKDSQ